MHSGLGQGSKPNFQTIPRDAIPTLPTHLRLHLFILIGGRGFCCLLPGSSAEAQPLEESGISEKQPIGSPLRPPQTVTSPGGSGLGSLTLFSTLAVLLVVSVQFCPMNKLSRCLPLCPQGVPPPINAVVRNKEGEILAKEKW